MFPRAWRCIMTVELLEGVVVEITTIGERMMLCWLFLHHDYDELKIGNMRIKSKWIECEDGQYYRAGKHGKYVYDLTYPNTENYMVELKDIELDEANIMSQLNNGSYDYNNFADTQHVAGAKHNYRDANLSGYTNKNVTKLSCPLSNPLCSQDSLTVYFECDDEGKTLVMKPVKVTHSNVIYADIEHIGTDEASDAELFNLKSKADTGYLIRLEIDYDDIINVCAHRLRIAENGMLFHD